MAKLYVVGIGPGGYDGMTIRALRALEDSQVIAGYTVYVDLVREHFPDKEFVTTPMTRERERCRMALALASEGRNTAVICSGDAGVYGMAELVLGMQEEFREVETEVIPGVTAALSGAAVLGAPLIHDFSVISLSDLLTPWEKIEARLRAAASADFVICLYNPSSRKRKDYLSRACSLVLEYQNKETVCGYVSNIGRRGEEMHLCTLEELKDAQTDMFTTVFIGNSQTRIQNGHMITPRGYKND